MKPVSISFKHLDSSEALKARTSEKFEALSNLLDQDATVEVTYWEYDKKKVAEANVRSKGNHFFAKANSDDFYKTLDLLRTKIKTQILKNKDQATR